MPEANKPEDPGALKVYGFKDGVLSNLASIQRGNGLGFGPRHFDIHPTQPWLFLSVERQSELHVYRLNDDGTLPRDAMFIKNALADRANHTPHADGRRDPRPSERPVRLHDQPQLRHRGDRRQEGVQGRREQRRGVLDRSGDRRADADPEHRGADHSSAHLRHRSERAPADRGQHPADGDARRLDAAGRARALSHRRRRQARRSRANTTSTPAASCSSGPASSRCRSAPLARVIVACRWRRCAETCLAPPRSREECHEKTHDRRRRCSSAPPASPARRTIRTRRSTSSAASRPAAPPTFPRAWSAPRWARSSASRSWSRTGSAPRRASPAPRSRARRRTATRCSSPPPPT